MVKNMDTYVCRKPAYTEERNGHYLLIWDDIPNWMVVDEEAFLFIQKIQGETSVQEIINQFQSITETPADIVKSIIQAFVKAKILYEPGNPSQFLREPDKIMSIIVYPTNECNLRCVMCYNKENLLGPGGKRGNEKNRNELTAEEFNDFLDQVYPFLADKGTSLQMLGGEPLIAPEKTLAIVEHASPLVEDILISTNGTLITKELAQRISAVKNANVQVSLDSPYRETHEALRGKGTFDRTVKGIKILLEENVRTVMSMVCHDKNLGELGKYYELGIQLGVPHVRFIPLQQAGAGITCGLTSPSFPYLMEKAFSVFKENSRYRKVMGSDFLSTTARLCHVCAVQGWCGTGSRLVMLNADGNVYPCPNHHLPEFKAGNIREESFADIWENSEALKKIRSTYAVTALNEKCAACPVRYWCVGWCRGETYQMTGSMTVPSVKCEEVRQMLIDMFFRLSEEKEVFGTLTKEFGKALSLDQI